MPERNILRIYGDTIREGSQNIYRYLALIHQETAKAFHLHGEHDDEEFLLGTVNSILDNKGQVLTIVNTERRFKARRIYQHLLREYRYAVVIPEDLIQDYGIRPGEYLDVTLSKIDRPTKLGGDTPIFSRILRYGQLGIRPKTLPAQAPQLTEVLIDKQFTDPFFSGLVLEINLAYGFGLVRSALVLYRILLENLLIELLRAKFGMERIDLFFNEALGRFHSLSVLITNLRANLTDFQPYSSGLDEGFVQRLSRYRERANASAHHLESEVTTNFFSDNKHDMNFVCNLLVTTIERLTGRNL